MNWNVPKDRIEREINTKCRKRLRICKIIYRQYIHAETPSWEETFQRKEDAHRMDCKIWRKSLILFPFLERIWYQQSCINGVKAVCRDIGETTKKHTINRVDQYEYHGVVISKDRTIKTSWTSYKYQMYLQSVRNACA